MSPPLIALGAIGIAFLVVVALLYFVNRALR